MLPSTHAQGSDSLSGFSLAALRIGVVGSGILGASGVISPTVLHLGIALALFGLLGMRSPLHRMPTLWVMLPFAAWLVLADAFSDFDPGFRISPILTGLVLVPVGWGIARDSRLLAGFLIGVLAGVLLSGSLGLLQFFIGYQDELRPFRLDASGDRYQYASGLMSHHIRFGMMIFAAGLILLAAHSQRRRFSWGWLGVIMAVIGTIISGSRGVLLAVVPTIWVWFIAMRRPRTMLVASMAVLSFGAAAFSALWMIHPERVERMMAGEDVRLRYWDGARMMIQEYPWFGVGSRNYPRAYELGVAEKGYPDARPYVHAHNSLIQLAATSGLPAVIFFLGFLVALMLAYRSRCVESPTTWRLGLAMMVFFLVSGMTEDNLGQTTMRNYFFLLFGVILGWPSAETSQQAESSHEPPAGDQKPSSC